MTMTSPTQAKWIPTDDSFGARLALIRQKQGWNMKEASRECGLPQNSWISWESGRSPRAIVEIAMKISERTGVDEMWLITGRSGNQRSSD